MANPFDKSAPQHGGGISNRETPREESEEREDFPPQNTGSPAPEDASGHVGEQPLEHTNDLQTAHKAGSRSVAQKEDESRYPDRGMPASHKVGGAFGKEADNTEKEEGKGKSER